MVRCKAYDGGWVGGGIFNYICVSDFVFQILENLKATG